MQKIAFVFPGQGSQQKGMLAELYSAKSIVQDTFAEASEVLGTDLWHIVSENPDGLLDQTAFTQPALLVASYAIWRAWMQEKGPLPDMLAGHSLGEYSALVCAGVLSFSDAVRLVNLRGSYMQEAVPAGVGAMAAIIGMDDSRIDGICRDVSGDQRVSAANYNSPGQTVIAGDKAAVERAMEACKEAGAKRALPLNVSVPSHCALMKPAAEKLGEAMQDVAFKAPSLPVVQNINGRACREPSEIRENLLKQLYMPVQWVDTIYCMQDFGIGTIVECGPGKVLAGLIKRINKDIHSYGTDSSETLSHSLQAVSQ